MTDSKDEYTAAERLRIDEEFIRLQGKYYLDHAGATLYAASQIKSVCDNLTENLFCNPHTSKTTEDLIDQVRYKILSFFNTDSSKYTVIFTSGATGSLKTVAENFNFNGSGSFVHLQDNHTSVLGMREVVNTSNIVNIKRDDLLKIEPVGPAIELNAEHDNSLVVFPAQCNFNGFKYPLELIDNVQSSGVPAEGKPLASKWYVCLDAASYVSTNFLDLTKYQPDYVCISFYKIFGYPTGLGALLVSERGAKALKKKYYGGGTVQIAMSSENWHQKRESLHERFEDGTIPFLSIISLLKGFETLNTLVPPVNHDRTTINRISRHTFQLGKYLYDRLKELKHLNGAAVVRFYNDTTFEDAKTQGGIVNFNLMHSDGSYVGFAEVACMANIYNIYLRTGCFCNPGACQRLLQLSDDDVKKHFKAGHICGDANDIIDGCPTGSVRISVGYMTNKSDLDTVYDMIVNCYVRNKISSLDKREILSNYKVDVLAKSKLAPRVKRVLLQKICIYPIKSAAAFKITTQWPVTHKGLKYDRDWVIVNGVNGVAVTQKHEQRLCLLRPEIDGNTLRLSFPYMSDIEIPCDKSRTEKCIKTAAIMCQTKVCGDRIEGYDCGDEVAEWLSEALCTNGLRLLRQSDSVKRILKNGQQKGGNGVAKEISLTNQAQYLLINIQSVRWLASKVDDWADVQYSDDFDLEGVVDRFRGNLIVDTDSPLVENDWTDLKIGGIDFKIDGPCTRCQMISYHQSTGEKTVEPLRTIAREFQGKMRFGIYLSHASIIKPDSVLSCGEEILIDVTK